MLSYEGVIRKRLRLKGHPEIPPYKPQSVESDAPPSATASASGSTPVPRVAEATEDVRGSLSGNGLVPTAVSAEEIRVRNEGDNPEEITPLNSHETPGPNISQQPQDVTRSPVPSENSKRKDEEHDLRTATEKRYDDIILEREEELMRKEASRSYREKVDVRLCSLYSGFVISSSISSYFFYFCLNNRRLTFFFRQFLNAGLQQAASTSTRT